VPWSKRNALVAAAVFGFALLLRLFGIGWGLPDDLHNQSFHPDEYLIWSQSQRVEPAKLSFTPGFYNYGTLYLTLLRVSSDVTAAYSGGPKEGDPQSRWEYIARCNLVGRVLSALAGAGTAAVLFFLILRFASLWGAVFGSVLIAVAPGFVVHSRFQTVDVLATFLIAASALHAAKLVSDDPENGRAMKNAVLCGVFAGLSAGTKYTGMLALFSLYAALGLIPTPKKLQLALAGTGAALAVFVLTTPGILLDSAAFFRDFAYEMAHTSSGHGLLFEGTPSGFLYHLINLQVGLGVLLFLVSSAGLLYALFRGPWKTYFDDYRAGEGSWLGRHLQAKWQSIVAIGKEQPWAWVLFAFWLPYFLLIGRAEVKFLRYTFPLYIALSAGLGYAISEARKRGGWGHAVVAVAILALGGFDPGGLRKTLSLSTTMQARDAREQAVDTLRDLEKQHPGLTVGFANDPWYYSPPTFPDTGLFRAAPFLQGMYGEMEALARPRSFWYIPPEVLADPQWDPEKVASRPRWDVRLLTEKKPDYVVLSNFETYDIDRLQGRRDISIPAQNEVAQATAFLTSLKNSYDPVKQFGQLGDTVNDMMYVEPVVILWKRKGLP